MSITHHVTGTVRLAIALIMVLLLFIPGGKAHAQSERCFPQTGHCISGRFREYWEQNGGLAVFGYPIRGIGVEGGSQMFERAEFELHPENAAPYDVLLARLSDQRFAQQDLSWEALPRDDGPKPGCLWFKETQRNVCDQQPGAGFLSYWQTHGLKDPKLNAYGRGLALFGLPLTSARTETNDTGDQVITQWFERARFEWHPDKPKENRVLLGLMGREVIDNQPSGAEDTARAVLQAYFTALYDGRYHAASQLYGGSYDVLRDMNPQVAPNDRAGLLRNACAANGYQCLRIKRIVSMEKVAPERAEWRLTVEFANRDGSHFVRGSDGRSQFPYVVRWDGEHFRVMSLPIYVA